MEIASLGGRFIKRVSITKDFKEIFPSSEYIVKFAVEGKQLFVVPTPKTLIPVLQMDPPVFQGDDELSSTHTAWRGSEPARFNQKADGSWKLEAQVRLTTYRFIQSEEMSPNVVLKLGFQDENGLLFGLDMIEIGQIPVHLHGKNEVFRELIQLDTVKKLPTSYSVLAISPDQRFHTNLIFLSKRLCDLETTNASNDRMERAKAAKAALVRFFREAYSEIIRQHPGMVEIEKYQPQSYEDELNYIPLLNDIVDTIAITKSGMPAHGKVLVSIYQTSDFVRKLTREGWLGLCLFGFGSVAPERLHVIFDLCQLRVDYNEAINPCRVEEHDLKRIAEYPSAEFEKYTPNLLKSLTRGQIESDTVSTQSKSIEEMGLSDLASSLRSMEHAAGLSKKSGCFVTSEPTLTDKWIDLGVFDSELKRSDIERELSQAINCVIDRFVQKYQIDNPKNSIFILNMCCEGSGLANELPTLWQFSHPKYETGDVILDSETNKLILPDEIENPNTRWDIFIIAPFDSYVNRLEEVLQSSRRQDNEVLCLITLFSMARTWDYLTPSRCFDIIPLFRVHPDPEVRGVISLTNMRDYLRLKPWLFKE